MVISNVFLESFQVFYEERQEHILQQKLEEISQRTNSVSDQVECVDRNTLGVDQQDRHQLRPKKVHDGLEFEDMEILPKILFYCHY